MDDINLDAKAIEIWIQEELVQGHTPDSMADEILKRWEKGLLRPDAKLTAGKFCLANGFVASLFRILQKDLRQGYSLPWPLVFQALLHVQKKTPKETVDSCLAGATRDGQLHALAAQALKQNHSDPRWQKIFASEVADRLSSAKEKRNKLMGDIRIFQNEGMKTEISDALSQVLSLFPEDTQGKLLAKQLRETQAEQNLVQLRTHRVSKRNLFEDTEAVWPELSQALEKLRGQLSLEEVYLVTVGLFEMGLYEKAWDVLLWEKSHWQVREKIWELELLEAQKRYAEVLSHAQLLIRKHENEHETVRSALYFTAKAYYGLEDYEQATSVMRGIAHHDPGYRDASILLVEWGARP